MCLNSRLQELGARTASSLSGSDEHRYRQLPAVEGLAFGHADEPAVAGVPILSPHYNIGSASSGDIFIETLEEIATVQWPADEGQIRCVTDLSLDAVLALLLARGIRPLVQTDAGSISKLVLRVSRDHGSDDARDLVLRGVPRPSNEGAPIIGREQYPLFTKLSAKLQRLLLTTEHMSTYSGSVDPLQPHEAQLGSALHHLMNAEL